MKTKNQYWMSSLFMALLSVSFGVCSCGDDDDDNNTSFGQKENALSWGYLDKGAGLRLKGIDGINTFDIEDLKHSLTCSYDKNGQLNLVSWPGWGNPIKIDYESRTMYNTHFTVNSSGYLLTYLDEGFSLSCDYDNNGHIVKMNWLYDQDEDGSGHTQTFNDVTTFVWENDLLTQVNHSTHFGNATSTGEEIEGVYYTKLNYDKTKYVNKYQQYAPFIDFSNILEYNDYFLLGLFGKGPAYLPSMVEQGYVFTFGPGNKEQFLPTYEFNADGSLAKYSKGNTEPTTFYYEK